MRLIIEKNYMDMSKAAAGEIAAYIRGKPNSLLCMAAGSTPTGIYKELAEMKRQNLVDFSSCRFIGLDEWVGLSKEDRGSCTEYIYSNLFEPLNIADEKIFFFDARAENLQRECERADAFLTASGGIDLSLMGVGMNGHIGLNEPGSSFCASAHVAPLSKTTKDVAQKYFESFAKLNEGITLGLGQILASDCLMIVASETKKAEIIRQAMEGDVTTEIPASCLQKHKNCIVYLDLFASAALKKQ